MFKDLSRDDYKDFVVKAIQALDPDRFKDVWDLLPRDLRAVANLAPAGVEPNVKSLPLNQQWEMYMKVNQLRLERCIHLSESRQRGFWTNESWQVVALSRLAEDRYFDLARVIPICDRDPVKWSATLAFLKNCTEKPCGNVEVHRHFDSNSFQNEAGARPDSDQLHGSRGGPTATEFPIEDRNGRGPPSGARSRSNWRSRSRDSGPPFGARGHRDHFCTLQT